MSKDKAPDKRRIEEAIAQVKYKPGWHVRVRTVAPGRFAVHWRFAAPDCTKEGQPTTWWSGREWLVEGTTSIDSLLKTLLLAARQAEEHECLEAFTYQGRRVFDPHTAIADTAPYVYRAEGHPKRGAQL